MISPKNQNPASPVQKEIILLLIAEELKSRKFFNTLLALGLDDSYFQPHLDEIILTFLGLNDNTNATLDFYFAVMEKHCRKIEKEQESAAREAFKVYKKLKSKAR